MLTMPHVLTFDLGTTYFKAAVFDSSGALVALARRPTPLRHPAPGRVEMPAGALPEAITHLAAALREQAPDAYASIRAISFASQANSFLLLDQHDQPLTPIILWTDQRATDQADWLVQFNALPERYATTGIPVAMPGQAPAKLRWLEQHQPDVLRSARRFCLISDELTRWLSGAHVTEAGVAALTGLLDIHTCRWWPPALDLLPVDRAILPEPVRAGTDVGALSAHAAAALQLPGDVRVIVGCLDQYAGAIAAGNLSPGNVSETTGTVLAVVAAADRFDPTLQARGVYQGPSAVPGLYYRMVFSGVAASLLEAYQRGHAPDLSFAQLDQLAADARAIGTDTTLDVAASEAAGRPIFRHAPDSHGHAALAIMRAVARRLREHLDTVCGNSRPTHITCLGGAARSDLWRELKEHATGLPMHTAGTDEPTCLGAAICARETSTRLTTPPQNR